MQDEYKIVFRSEPSTVSTFNECEWNSRYFKVYTWEWKKNIKITIAVVVSQNLENIKWQYPLSCIANWLTTKWKTVNDNGTVTTVSKTPISCRHLKKGRIDLNTNCFFLLRLCLQLAEFPSKREGD